jgi:hypothetical protein
MLITVGRNIGGVLGARCSPDELGDLDILRFDIYTAATLRLVFVIAVSAISKCQINRALRSNVDSEWRMRRPPATAPPAAIHEVEHAIHLAARMPYLCRTRTSKCATSGIRY